MTQDVPEVLDNITDTVLAHRPKAKQKKPRKRRLPPKIVRNKAGLIKPCTYMRDRPFTDFYVSVTDGEVCVYLNGLDFTFDKKGNLNGTGICIPEVKYWGEPAGGNNQPSTSPISPTVMPDTTGTETD
jgi:hypothetical protein